jgi:hypothetical protein
MSQKSDDAIVQFIRVGVDMGCGGCQSRVFADRHYHFIAIPKHNDPEFCRFTYGDVASNAKHAPRIKGRSLTKLRRGDYLAFYAGFENDQNKWCVGVFAYLVVEHAYLIDRSPAQGIALSFAKRSRDYDPFRNFETDGSPTKWKQILSKYKKFSQHVSETQRNEMEVLICGDRNRSRLLPKVEILANYSPRNKAYITSTEISQRFGLKHKTDLKRSSVRTVTDKIATRVIQHLEKLGSSSMDCERA